MTDSEPAGGLAHALEENRTALLRFLTVRAGSVDDAEDLLQDLWLKVAQTRSGPVASPRSYLFRMANNLVLDRARARRRAMLRDRSWVEEDGPVTEADRPDPAPDADSALLEQEEARAVRTAIESLPDGARRALTLYRFEGRPQADIARIMGITLSGVEKHLATAMKRLRKELADCGFDSVASSDTDRKRETVPAAKDGKP